MSKTYYNLAGVEDLEQFTNTTRVQIEESASALLTQAGIIADGTRGFAADSHQETAMLADQVSAKAAEVTAMVQHAVQEARNATMDVDTQGAKLMSFGG